MSEKNNNPAKNEIILKMFNPKNEISNLEKEEISRTKALDETDRKWNMNDKIIDSVTESVKADRNLRLVYAIILMIILAFELVALTIIFILNGANVLHYSDTTLNVFTTAGIAEVFVLVRVIVKYLFKDNLTDSLNIILKNNNVKEYNRSNYYKQNNKGKNDEKQNAQNKKK